MINQPPVAILATGAVRPRPVAVPAFDGSYVVVVHPVGILALTLDHRAALPRLKESGCRPAWPGARAGPARPASTAR
ncbi:2-oxo acid dehydrogenase subunit E2 [Streptomyces sp. NPDC058470]|uniref:2-oxo acid dehydrogenase subunit E2 n=1 Tax=Streptomyces sp. NPDC058470 TaxID=3346515 RepID=UPI00365A1E5C